NGICVDRKGHIYVTVKRNVPEGESMNGIYIFSQAGKKLGFIPISENLVTGCCFGGSDSNNLLVTAGGNVYKVNVTWSIDSSDKESDIINKRNSIITDQLMQTRKATSLPSAT